MSAWDVGLEIIKAYKQTELRLHGPWHRRQLSRGGGQGGFLKGERLAFLKSLLSPGFHPSGVSTLTVIPWDRLPLFVLLPVTKQEETRSPYHTTEGPESHKAIFFPLLKQVKWRVGTLICILEDIANKWLGQCRRTGQVRRRERKGFCFHFYHVVGKKEWNQKAESLDSLSDPCVCVEGTAKHTFGEIPSGKKLTQENSVSICLQKWLHFSDWITDLFLSHIRDTYF